MVGLQGICGPGSVARMRAALYAARRPENLVLLVFFAAAGVVTSLAAYHHWHQLPKRSEMILRFAFSTVIAFWVMCDSAHYGIRRPFIFGVFLLFAWPVLAPWHLVRTRKWRALITLAIFLALFAMAFWLPTVVFGR